MANRLETVQQTINTLIADKIVSLTSALGELTLVVDASSLLDVAAILSKDESLAFRLCIDLCGVDYSDYRGGDWTGKRFAVVYHLLSVAHNVRLRLKTFCPDDELPAVDSVLSIWPGFNWFEREAFDLYGILFIGHPDLRRILTDYGFVGHPFRKDFPLSGYVEMRYDPTQARVIYQPVSIVPREITPRIIREENYGG